MRLIDADALYEKLKADEDLARQRVIDTPNSFPNGSLNPAAVRYMAQLSERTRLKEMIYDAPTVVEFDGEITKVIVRGKVYVNPECVAEMKGKVDGRDDTETEQPDH